MKIYAIRDLNVGFNSPFVESGDAVAIRGFSYAMNNNDMMGLPLRILIFIILVNMILRKV